MIFQIHFIRNAHNWGVLVVDPDGNTITKFAKIGIGIAGVTMKVDDFEVTIDVFDDDEIGLYEIYYR